MSQRITKLISHTIINVYANIHFINNGLTVVQKLMCNGTHHKTYGLVSTDVNEMHMRMVYIIDDIVTSL